VDRTTDLTDIAVLVVEDDYFIATEMAGVLRQHGARVLGPVPDTQRARELLRRESPDVALLDVNLRGRMSYDLAEELLEHGVPAVFATGYDASILPAPLRGMPCLLKPVDTRELVRVIHASGARA